MSIHTEEIVQYVPPSIVRKATILIGKARFLLLLTIGFVAGHTFASWQLQTAMKIAWEFGRQQAVMAAQYQRDFPEKFKTTKAQAQTILAKKDKERTWVLPDMSITIPRR